MILENERLHQDIAELTAQRDEARAERDEAKSEIAMIRENCYYACVSKKHAQADLNRVARDFGEVADHWRNRAAELEAERDELISAARELIESTDTSMDGPTVAAVVDGGPFDRLKALVRRAAGLDRGEG